MTTHNMDEAYKMCDNIAMICAGKIIEYGKPVEICKKYNIEQNIKISLVDNTDVLLKNDARNAEKIYELLRSGNVNAIHSSEPDLRTVFIQLTGRELV